jgi:hypothetical protein
VSSASATGPLTCHLDALAPSPRGVGRGLYALSIGGQLADWASTVHFQSTGRLVETNPRLADTVAHHPVRFFALKAGTGLGFAVLGDTVTRAADRRNARWTRRLGRAIPIIVGGWGLYVAGRNELRLARARR